MKDDYGLPIRWVKPDSVSVIDKIILVFIVRTANKKMYLYKIKKVKRDNKST